MLQVFVFILFVTVVHSCWLEVCNGMCTFLSDERYMEIYYLFTLNSIANKWENKRTCEP